MSVTATVTAFQSLHAGISGVRSAPSEIPGALNTADLPLALTWADEGQWAPMTMGHGQQVRTYRVSVYVKPVGQGRGRNEGYAACKALLQAFGVAYLANWGLSGAVTFVNHQLDDSGIVELSFGEHAYWGFEFRVPVLETI